jgi:hypothetical protein
LMLTVRDLLPKSPFVGANTATILLLPAANLIRNVAVPECVNCAVPYNPSPERQLARVASQKLTKPVLTMPGSVTVAVIVTMAPVETGPLGETASIVVVAEVTTARKFVVAVARMRKPTKSFTADPETCLPPLQNDSETIGRPKREATVLLFVAWSETARFPIVFTLKLLDSSVRFSAYPSNSLGAHSPFIPVANVRWRVNWNSPKTNDTSASIRQASHQGPETWSHSRGYEVSSAEVRRP